jgi:hypothetical protein
VIECVAKVEEASFRTVDPFDEALGAAQPTGSWSNLAAQVKDGAEPAGTAGGGQWLAGVEVGPVCPSHRFSEVGISSAEVG